MDNKSRCGHNFPDHLCPICGDGTGDNDELEGILVIIDGKVKCADEEEPKLNDFEKYSIVQTITDIEGYEQACKKFEESCKDVVNIDPTETEGVWLYRGSMVDVFVPRHRLKRVLYVPEGDKVRITQLLGGPPNSKINN